MGSFFYFSGLDQVIQAFANAVDTGRASATKLLLIGGGEQDTVLRELVRSLGLNELVIFTGFVHYAQLPDYLALSTVTINPLKKSLVTDTALPHKVLQYLAMGLPVVSTPLDGLQSVFGLDSGIVWGSNPKEILDTALLLAADSKGLASASAAAKHAVQSKLGAQEAAEKLEAFLLRLSKGKTK